MEDSKQSDELMEVFKNLNKSCMTNSLRVDGIEEQLDEIQEQLQKIFWFIEFHLGEVPLKYRKAFPQEGEYPYIKTKTSFKVNPINHSPSFPKEFDEPTDKAEYQESLKRMEQYGKEKKSHVPEFIETEEEKSTRVSLEAFSTPSAEPDSHQVYKHPESSQSLNGVPDHNNPPSLT